MPSDIEPRFGDMDLNTGKTKEVVDYDIHNGRYNSTNKYIYLKIIK